MQEDKCEKQNPMLPWRIGVNICNLFQPKNDMIQAHIYNRQIGKFI